MATARLDDDLWKLIEPLLPARASDDPIDFFLVKQWQTNRRHPVQLYGHEPPSTSRLWGDAISWRVRLPKTAPGIAPTGSRVRWWRRRPRVFLPA